MSPDKPEPALQFDELIHQPVRLRVMASLVARPVSSDQVEFTWLKRVLGLTDGNLGAHLQTLEQANYVAVEKDFLDRRPRTRIAATPKGRLAFANHVAALEAILHSAGEAD
jgi:DNA-binding MarR family transcriptional regulator